VSGMDLPGEVALPVNPISQAIDNILNILIQSGEAAAKTYITAQVPILEAPVVDVFTNSILDALTQAIENQTAKIVATVVNDLQTQMQNSTVLSSANALSAAQAQGDKGAIQAATTNLVNAYRNLGAFNGV